MAKKQWEPGALVDRVVKILDATGQADVATWVRGNYAVAVELTRSALQAAGRLAGATSAAESMREVSADTVTEHIRLKTAHYDLAKAEAFRRIEAFRVQLFEAMSLADLGDWYLLRMLGRQPWPGASVAEKDMIQAAWLSEAERRTGEVGQNKLALAERLKAMDAPAPAKTRRDALLDEYTALASEIADYRAASPAPVAFFAGLPQLADVAAYRRGHRGVSDLEDMLEADRAKWAEARAALEVRRAAKASPATPRGPVKVHLLLPEEWEAELRTRLADDELPDDIPATWRRHVEREREVGEILPPHVEQRLQQMAEADAGEGLPPGWVWDRYGGNIAQRKRVPEGDFYVVEWPTMDRRGSGAKYYAMFRPGEAPAKGVDNRPIAFMDRAGKYTPERAFATSPDPLMSRIDRDPRKLAHNLTAQAPDPWAEALSRNVTLDTVRAVFGKDDPGRPWKARSNVPFAVANLVGLSASIGEIRRSAFDAHVLALVDQLEEAGEIEVTHRGPDAPLYRRQFTQAELDEAGRRAGHAVAPAVAPAGPYPYRSVTAGIYGEGGRHLRNSAEVTEVLMQDALRARTGDEQAHFKDQVSYILGAGTITGEQGEALYRAAGMGPGGAFLGERGVSVPAAPAATPATTSEAEVLQQVEDIVQSRKAEGFHDARVSHVMPRHMPVAFLGRLLTELRSRGYTVDSRTSPATRAAGLQDMIVSWPKVPAKASPPATVEEAEKRIAAAFTQAGWAYVPAGNYGTNSYLTAPNGAFRFQLKARNIRGQHRGENGKGWFDGLSYGGIKDAGGAVNNLLQRGQLQAERYAGNAPVAKAKSSSPTVDGSGLRVEVRFTPAQGLTVEGDTRPLKDLIKAEGLRWDGGNTRWVLRGSAGLNHAPEVMQSLIENLRATGAEVAVKGKGAAAPSSAPAEPPDAYVQMGWPMARNAEEALARRVLITRVATPGQITSSRMEDVMGNMTPAEREHVVAYLKTTNSGPAPAMIAAKVLQEFKDDEGAAPAKAQIPADVVREAHAELQALQATVDDIDAKGTAAVYMPMDLAAKLKDIKDRPNQLLNRLLKTYGDAAVDAHNLRKATFQLNQSIRRAMNIPLETDRPPEPRQPDIPGQPYRDLTPNPNPRRGVHADVTLGDFAKAASDDVSRWGLHQISCYTPGGLRTIAGFPMPHPTSCIFATDGSWLLLLPVYGREIAPTYILLNNRHSPVDKKGNPLRSERATFETFEKYGVPEGRYTHEGETIGQTGDAPNAVAVLPRELDRLNFYADMTPKEAATYAKALGQVLTDHGTVKGHVAWHKTGKASLSLPESKKNAALRIDDDRHLWLPGFRWKDAYSASSLGVNPIYLVKALGIVGKAGSPGDLVRVAQVGGPLDPIVVLLVSPDGTLKLLAVVMPVRLD